jgi:glycosyltransferase involved in cell wall biosynthesis
MRSPVGGLFRHVVDVATEQTARGHVVGIVADAATGSAAADRTLAELDEKLSLGVTRVAMSRQIGPGDIRAICHVGERAAAADVDILHGHGAKGGAFARLAPVGRKVARVYTPHGGSLHFARTNPVGLIYLSLEQMLLTRTDLILFESAFARETFVAKVGDTGNVPVRIVHNGVRPAEFEPVVAAPDATDILFVGELRRLKGVDVLLQALTTLPGTTATIVGDGPDRAAFETMAADLALTGRVRFPGAMPARAAFGLGRLLVVPSRAESLPYIVLEAGAAGLPLVATRVGGIPEIVGETGTRLVAPDDPAALADALHLTLADIEAGDRSRSAFLGERIARSFSLATMTDGILSACAGIRAEARVSGLAA